MRTEQQIRELALAYFRNLGWKPSDSDAAHLCDFIWGALCEVEAEHGS